jgi:hypothetical protein
MKCHSEIPCRAILNKQKCLFSKTENRKVKQVLSGNWYECVGGYNEMVKKAECSKNILMNEDEKNGTCWNSSRNGVEMKENDGGGEFNYNIL